MTDIEEIVARIDAEMGHIVRGYANRRGELLFDVREALAGIATLTVRCETLFDAIAHGDEQHREWLRAAIDAHFAGEPVPPVAGLGSAPHPAPDAPCKGCTGYWYDNGVLRCDDECPAPDAPQSNLREQPAREDWKVDAEAVCDAYALENQQLSDRAEAAEAKWSHYAKLLDEQHGTPCEQIRHREALNAAQAEIERLREALEKAEEWNRLRAEDIVTLGHLAGQAEHLREENEHLRRMIHGR